MRRKPLLLAAAGAVVAAAVAVAVPSAHAAATITNPGFESNGASQTPSGWTEGGTTSASKSEAGGHSGSYQLAHWASSSYWVETRQTLTGLTAGVHNVTAWVRSGGGQRAAYIALRSCGGAEVRTNIPTSPSTWVQISASVNVTGTTCTVAIVSDGNANNWINADDVSFTRSGGTPTTATTRPPQPGVQIRGADVSSVKKNEDHGAVYYDAGGTRRDVLEILKNSGVNWARLKVWVNPADGYNNKNRVLEMARRIKAQGLNLLVDFHYSDSWADPGQQRKPAAWANHNVTQLRDDVYNHTYDVCNSLRLQGTPADMVQVGNEINPGMLLPEGSSDNANWGNLAMLLTAGSQAVKAANSSTRVMLHLGNGGDNGLYRWWFDNATSRGVPFDVIGLSFYPYWHGTMSALRTNLNDMASRYNKDVLLTETAYGFTLQEKDFEPNIFNSSLQQAGGYPASPAGQQQLLRDAYAAVRAVPNGRGLGVIYWEPAWTAVPGGGWDPTNPNSGNGWENQALFDYNSRALPGLATLGSGN